MQYEHRPELADQRWAHVTEIAHPDPDITYYYGPTGTVHLEGCPQINRYTTFRSIEPTEPIVRRCEHCLRRDADYQIADIRRRHEEAVLIAARAADPDLMRRVHDRRARRLAERRY